VQQRAYDAAEATVAAACSQLAVDNFKVGMQPAHNPDHDLGVGIG
jgi:hypothetical protein